jgi:FixJ family two-component response regulator
MSDAPGPKGRPSGPQIEGGVVTSSRKRTPDCLILDLNLPGMTGLELQQQLATDHCRIPIVVVSAHDDAASRRQALHSGASAFPGKPFNDEALLEAIHSAMKPGTPKSAIRSVYDSWLMEK